MKLLTLVCAMTAVVHSTLSVEPKAANKAMVCYYGSWAVYRPGDGKFDVENIDTNICTHIIYGFAGLGNDNTIISLDPWNDLGTSEPGSGLKGFDRFVGLKQSNPDLKALLAIGGWNEGSEKYSKMASDPAQRAKFVTSVVNFLTTYKFDGLDVDWEYPASRGGVPSDKDNFINLIRDLKTAFAPYGFMLTAAVSPGKETIDDAYDIPAMSSILDHIHVMGYDYHGEWDPYTGHNSPLFLNPNIDVVAPDYWFNQDYTVNYFINNGADPSKIILGMPTYGRGFVLKNAANSGFYAETTGGIPAAPYTRQSGIWGYNEICDTFSKEPGQWTIIRDSYYQAPYAYKGNWWMGYDDQESLKTKAEYVVSMNLGGAMVWSLETDDFHGYCHGKTFPLIKTIYETMNGPVVGPTTPTRGPTTPPGTTVSGGTGPSTQATSTTPRPTRPTPPPSDVCTAEGYFPVPGDCTKFYQCIANGNGWLVYYFDCGAGTVFNPNTGNCDFPANVPGCNISVRNGKHI